MEKPVRKNRKRNLIGIGVVLLIVAIIISVIIGENKSEFIQPQFNCPEKVYYAPVEHGTQNSIEINAHCMCTYLC